MLSRADAELARRDGALQRGLSLLLDQEAFADALRRHLPDIVITSARPVYVRYKPATNCLVAYRLSTGGVDLDVYAKAFATENCARVKLPDSRSQVQSLLGPGYLQLKGETVVVSFFPNDGKLKTLKRIHSNSGNSKLLRKLVPNRRDLWYGPVQLLRYKPERRFVGRIASASNEGAAVFKLYAGNALHAAYERARAFNSQGVLRVARPIGTDAHYGALALEWLDGTPVDDLLALTGSNEVVARVGEALAELHAQEPKGLRQWLPGSGMRSLLQMAQGLEQIAPPEGTRTFALASEIANRWSECETFGRPIHGDFYSSQVLSADSHISILDLDQATWGNPMWDLGNFLAHLERESLGSDARRSRLEETKSALVEGYARAVGWRVDSSKLSAFTAASLLKLAHHPFRLREHDWRSQTKAIIDRAAQLMAYTCHTRVTRPNPIPLSRISRSHTRNRGMFSEVIVSDPTGAVNDATMPFLRHALDPAEATMRLQKRLADLGGFRKQIELQGIRVTRHKPGRRCVVEYDLTLMRRGGSEEGLTLVGKARARALDDRCFQLQLALRLAGFNENNPDGIAVPEPVAIVPEFHMWLQRKVPGVMSSNVLQGSRAPWIARRIVDAIHKLQRAGITAPRQHSIEDELNLLNNRLASLTTVRPEWRSRLERVSEACMRLGRELAGRQLCPAHRDFYPEQVMLSGERLYLLDFDLYAFADPALDAGNFIAHVREQSLRHLGDPEALAHHERTIEQRFAAASDRLTRAALRKYATLTLARHIFISTCIPQRQRFTEAILEICERRLDISRCLLPHHRRLDTTLEGISHAKSNA